MNEQENTSTQIFAADGPFRGHAVRAGLVTGGILLAVWLVALVFGAWGGFGGLPHVDLPGATSDAHATKPVSGAKSGEADRTASDTPAVSPDPGVSKSPAKSNGSPAGSAAPAAPQTTPATPTHGKPVGAGAGDGSGKPAGTPGVGSTGSNAGGIGKANAYGHTRSG